ncbi:MAG: hypothetical protein QG576_218 [Bacteroidota bacterium]|nr:hypothetical protein [Bacteroidota bacterium]
MEDKYIKIIHSVTRGKTDNTFIQLIRYTFVGGLAFIIDFGTLFILTEYLNIHYLISAGIAFILGLTINYLISTIWVFSKRSFKNQNLEFLLFAFIGIAGLGLNELFMWVFTDLLLIYYLVSKIITTIIVYFWNFFARKYLLFN